MEERIQYLFRQYENNKCSHEEMEELFYYIRNVRNNDGPLKRVIKKIYDDIRKNHPSFTYVDENGRLILTEPDDTDHSARKRSLFKMNFKAPVMALLLTGIVMIMAVLWLIRKDVSIATPVRQNTGKAFTKKFSERSEHKYMLLPDSTEVWLNAASSLEFPDHFSDKKREVFLMGEAFFKVKHADKIPFIIHAGMVETIVLGTSFNIKAYPEGREVIVSVSQGKVNVKRNRNIVATLTKGQQVKIDNTAE